MDERALIVCPLLRREVDALKASGRVDGRVETFAHSCDPSAPDRATMALELARRADAPKLSTLLGGGCLRGVALPDVRPDRLRVVAAPTCFELIAPPALVEHLTSSGAHLVTPGWLAQWRKGLETWGLDHATARDLFAESARKLVLLDTGVDAAAPARLGELADYLGLPAEVVPVGLDFLGLRLREAAGTTTPPGPSSVDVPRPSQARRLADCTAVLDFTASLASTLDEHVVVERLADLCASLFAPEAFVFIPVAEGVQGPPTVSPADERLDGADLGELAVFTGTVAAAEDGRSLLARIGDAHTLGLLRLSRVAFPKFLEHYADLVWLVAEATSLALLHARSHLALIEAQCLLRGERDELDARVRERTAELERTVAELREATAHIDVLHGLLPICCGCKKIRDDAGSWRAIEEYLTKHSGATFSHGICPECFVRLYPDLSGEPEAGGR